MRVPDMTQRRLVGRPADPRSPRLDVWVDSMVKRRVIRCAVKRRVPLQDLVDTALRQYLTKQRVR